MHLIHTPIFEEPNMFYEVKVLDKEGQVKKVISSKTLSRKFWKIKNEGKEFCGKLGLEEDELEYKGVIPQASASRVRMSLK